MKLIDMHCDTLGKLLYGEMTQGQKTDKNNKAGAGTAVCDTACDAACDTACDAACLPDLMHNDFCISIPGMKKAGTLAQFFACFTYVKANPDGYDGCYRDALAMTDILKKQCALFPEDLAQAFSKADILQNEASGRISGLLTVEEGGILNGNMDRLEELYRRGVRLITPMWNFENCIGFPNSKDPDLMQKGLKPFGIEFVRRCGELGIILDVSHSSDGTFRDILAYASGPVIASHSNCRALCNHPRNLTDEMIRSLADHGGIAGLNLYGSFLDGSSESRIEVMAAHVQHMIRVGGEGFPAIGTDFDGFDGMIYEDIPTVNDMERLWDGLHKAGISEDQLDRIWRKNAEAVIP